MSFLIPKAYWMNKMCQVLQTFGSFAMWWFFLGSAIFHVLSNPTSSAHLRPWRTELYAQETCHEYNTLSFLQDRPYSKRFSLCSPHPNFFFAGLGLGQETEQGSLRRAQFLPKQGQNFQDGRGTSSINLVRLSSQIALTKHSQTFFPPTHPITNPSKGQPGSQKSSMSNQRAP